MGNKGHTCYAQGITDYAFWFSNWMKSRKYIMSDGCIKRYVFFPPLFSPLWYSIFAIAILSSYHSILVWHSPFAQGRYEIMRNYMPKVGSLGLDMMFRTCTVQVRWILHFQLYSLSETDPLTFFTSIIYDRLIWTSVRKLTWSGNFVLVLLCNLWDH